MSEGSDIRAVKHEWLLSVLAATGLDQQDFADRMGVRPDAFNHMVKNRRAVSDDTVDLICQTFNVRFVPAGKGAKPAPTALPLAVTVDQHGLMGIGDQAYKHYRGSFSTDDLDRAHERIRKRRR